MAKESPMNVKIFDYRVEFKARGAAHVHGVLWVDFKQKFTNELNNEILKSVFNKLKNEENLEDVEEKEVIKYIDIFVTCTLDKNEARKLLIRDCGDKDVLAAKAVEIAGTVNSHRHNKSCRKYNTACRFDYPKLPSVRTLLTKNPDAFYQDRLSKFDSIEERVDWLTRKMTANKKIIEKVKETLINYDEQQPDDPLLMDMKQNPLKMLF